MIIRASFTCVGRYCYTMPCPLLPSFLLSFIVCNRASRSPVALSCDRILTAIDVSRVNKCLHRSNVYVQGDQ